MTIYIVEHLEQTLWDWCIYEYENISKIVGRKNLWITNIKNKKERKKLERFGKAFEESVSKMSLKNICVLDPEANKTLEPKEAKKFEYFIFGGILGDFPPKKRTKAELTTKLNKSTKVRNIEKEQMATDNAVYVVKKIFEGKKISEFNFKNEIEIKTGKNESIILPYRYVLINGKPLINKKIVRYLKNKKDF